MHLKENKNRVSVVVPVYNVDKYLRRCVDSILAQDMSVDEIILVDDGSTDNSGCICDEYAARNSNVRAIHKTNGGLSSARKAGWHTADGDLIVFVDSDDYVERSFIRKLAQPFVNNEVELSMSSYATDKGGGIKAASLPYDSEIIVSTHIPSEYIIPLIGSITDDCAVNIPGFVPIRMYRTRMLRDSDFVSEREYFTEDIIMNILYAKRMKGSIALVNEPLYHYCVNSGSLTQKYRENAFGMLSACYTLCKDLTSDLNCNSEERLKRLDSNLVAIVTYSIYNIGRIKSYGQFKTELIRIFTDRDVAIIFKEKKWPLGARWYKIIYFSYRYRAYFLLFKMLKLRKTLSKTL